jgi:SAM-dependent methyltransferase
VSRIPPEDYFGPNVAGRYDDDEAEMFQPAAVEPAVELLSELAHGGPALELGIGTGRLALPLARRGVPVHGIDLSEAMVAKLREKPGAQDIGITIGDFSSATVPGEFALVYLVFNTIMNLISAEAQIACFRNAAAHLRAGGCFVIEVGIPQLRRLPPGETVRPFEVRADRFGFDEFDTASQRLVSHHYSVRDGSLEVTSMPFRYVWPSELDLMARIAGMSLRGRWADWSRQPFTSESLKHISVWQKYAGE